MLNSGNNDQEQNWPLLSPRVKRAESDWWATNPWVSKMGLNGRSHFCYQLMPLFRSNVNPTPNSIKSEAKWVLSGDKMWKKFDLLQL
jgi:hypothetical protein